MTTTRCLHLFATLTALFAALATLAMAEDGTAAAAPVEGVVMERNAKDGSIETAAPGPANAYFGSGWQAYLRVRWAMPDGKVRGKITGGVPAVEWDLDLPNRARRDLHDAGTYRILVPIRPGHAGTFRIDGKLVAPDGSEKAFGTTFRFHPHPDRGVTNRPRWNVQTGRLEGWLRFAHIQKGKRWAKISGGDAVRWAWVQFDKIQLSIPCPEGPPEAIEVSFVDWGERVTFRVPTADVERVGSEKAKVDEAMVEGAEKQVARARESGNAWMIESALHARATCYQGIVQHDPAPWVERKREAWAAAENVEPTSENEGKIIASTRRGWLTNDIMVAMLAGRIDLAEPWLEELARLSDELGLKAPSRLWKRYAWRVMEIEHDLEKAKKAWKKVCEIDGRETDCPVIPAPVFDE